MPPVLRTPQIINATPQIKCTDKIQNPPIMLPVAPQHTRPPDPIIRSEFPAIDGKNGYQEPIVGDKRSAPDAPDTDDDDGSQPERGHEAEAAGPKLDQDERQRTKKMRRDGEARNLSREERKMTASMRQIEEMEQNEKAVKAGPCLNQLEGRVVRVILFISHILFSLPFLLRLRAGKAARGGWEGGLLLVTVARSKLLYRMWEISRLQVV
jgi:hypothetical protein